MNIQNRNAVKSNQNIFFVSERQSIVDKIVGTLCLYAYKAIAIKSDYMYKKHIDTSMRYKHKVRIEKNSLLYEVLGKTELKVNSLHGGQVTDPGKYRIVAHSNDGLIEGMEYTKNRFNLGVQWHPEFLWKEDESANRIFSAFIDSSK